MATVMRSVNTDGGQLKTRGRHKQGKDTRVGKTYQAQASPEVLRLQMSRHMRMDRSHPRCRPKKNNTQIMRAVMHSRNHEAWNARHNQGLHPIKKTGRRLTTPTCLK